MSLTFKDAANREWNCKITHDAVDRAKEASGLDLYDLLGSDGLKLFEKILDDARAVLNIVWAIVKPQADAKSVTMADFAKSIDGDVFESLEGALVDAITDFSRGRARATLKKMIEKSRALGEATAKLVMAKIDQVDPEEEALKLVPPEKSFGKPQDSSESTPVPSPSANSS